MTITNARGQEIDLEESARVSAVVSAFDKACWWNAVAVLRQCYRTRPDAVYVEGWATTQFGFATEHGWVQLLGDRIIEPTPSWQEAEREGPPSCYFAAARYTVAQLKGLHMRHFPLALGDREKRDALREAGEQAMAFCIGMTVEKYRKSFAAFMGLVE